MLTSEFAHFFRRFLETEQMNPQTFSHLECMTPHNQANSSWKKLPQTIRFITHHQNFWWKPEKKMTCIGKAFEGDEKKKMEKSHQKPAHLWWSNEFNTNSEMLLQGGRIILKNCLLNVDSNPAINFYRWPSSYTLVNTVEKFKRCLSASFFFLPFSLELQVATLETGQWTGHPQIW